MKIEITKLEAKHILAFDVDCGNCHLHKFKSEGAKTNPRFNCKYNKKFRNILKNIL